MELKGNPELVAAFRRGDRTVLADLYRAHVGEVRMLLERGFSFTSKGSSIRFRGFTEPFRVQEVTQQIFVHAFRERARLAYDENQPYRPFLITIARNRVIDLFRKERSESALFVSASALAGPQESQEEALDRWASHGKATSPELAAYRSQLGGTLKQFIGELDEEDATILREHMLGEMTQHEVADAIGEHRNDVRKRIRLMRERLLRHMKREGFIGSLDPEELFSGE